MELAQGFGLVTPDPFSSRELGGVWARDYVEPDSHTKSGRESGSTRLVRSVYVNVTVCEDGVRGRR